MACSWAVLVGAALLLGGCTQGATKVACLSGAPPTTGIGTFVSGQTPAGIVGISNPDTYYQPPNSFPRGAASADGRCM